MHEVELERCGEFDRTEEKKSRSALDPVLAGQPIRFRDSVGGDDPRCLPDETTMVSVP